MIDSPLGYVMDTSHGSSNYITLDLLTVTDIDGLFLQGRKEQTDRSDATGYGW
jgi:hypothetical protein